MLVEFVQQLLQLVQLLEFVEFVEFVVRVQLIQFLARRVAAGPTACWRSASPAGRPHAGEHHLAESGAVRAEASEADLRARALAAVAAVVGQREPCTVIVVPGKIVSVVL
ncbi:hypothetical protein Vau01_098670 [Virgisporangium aurantiacum]|uniref:Uncharacterized protein n=1 Tax=Virgisporangium aurantiacum TaxID=175570 RepID=A0A8J4E5I7_9ACTN|nr:hypothetical protein Vau01_098670 [Virgisporangium aurantiacum]